MAPVGLLRRSAAGLEFLMSLATIRPPGPLPCTCSRLTPMSRAILRASGDERRASAVAGCGMATTFDGAAVRSTRGAFISIASAYSPVDVLDRVFLVDGAARGRRFWRRRLAFGRLRGLRRFGGAGFSPAPRIVASTPPTGTISPSFAREHRRACRPAPLRDRGSLCRSRSPAPARLSSRRRPAFLYQRTTFPSVIASPILGMMISAIRVHHFLHRRDDVLLVRRGQQLEVARVRHRHILARHARNRRVELVEDMSR